MRILFIKYHFTILFTKNILGVFKKARFVYFQECSPRYIGPNCTIHCIYLEPDNVYTVTIQHLTHWSFPHPQFLTIPMVLQAHHQQYFDHPDQDFMGALTFC